MVKTLAAAARCGRGQRGWTMVEVAATLVILSILVAIGYAEYSRQVLRARAVATVEELTVVRIAMVRYEADCGQPPSPARDRGDPGLTRASHECPGRWEGPYLDAWPATTPLGGSVVYFARGSGAGDGLTLGVDGLSASEADALSEVAHRTFDKRVSSASSRGPGSRRSFSVGTSIGDPSPAPGGARPSRTISGD